MKKFLLPMVALAVVATPVFAEDQDQPKQHKNRSENAPPPPRHVNAPPHVAPRTVPQPRVQQPKVQPNFSANNQLQNRRWSAPRTYTPKTFNPNTQAQTQPRIQTFTPPDQDAAR